MTFPINYGLLDVYGAALPAGMKEDMMSQVGQRFLNQPQQQPPQVAQQPQAMQAPQAMQSDPVQQQMAAAQEQQRQAQAMKIMGQGIAGMGQNRGYQPQPVTQQLMRDQGGPRMQGNQQQMMAQMLRRR